MSRPVPTRSPAERPAAHPAVLKACCAELWRHPGVRLLVGDALHPGGVALTDRALDALGLPAGARLLDLGSGPGTTRDLAAARGMRPVGIDLSAAWCAEERAGSFAVADAEWLPFRDGSFDGAIVECTLSVLPDKAWALSELRRVTARGGGVAVSDVTLEGTLPEELATLIGWIACAAGALPREGYVEALEKAGFHPRLVEDHPTALSDMIAKARRRLALLQGAAATGLVDISAVGVPPGLLDLCQRLLGLASEAVVEGTLGYMLIVTHG